MPSTEIVNAIGITAYTLALFLFVWVAQIPGASRAGRYWISAVLMILLARINLQFLPEYLPLYTVQSLYAVFLSFEKYFLIVGLLTHFNWRARLQNQKVVFFSGTALLSVLLTIFNVYLGLHSFFSLIFSATQAVALSTIAYILFIENRARPSGLFTLVCLTLIFYSIHWLSFPIALQYPSWLAYGFIIGNLLNIITYMFYVYLELFSFQTRLLKTEKEAIDLAEEAIAASKAKSEFLANMSHELRTPMNGVLGMLTLLKKADLHEKEKRKVKVAFDSANSLMDIINDILDFAKMDAGKLEIEPSECHLKGTLQSILEPFEVQIKQKNIDFQVNTKNIDAQVVKIDGARLKQILGNLLSNAIKFTDSGTIAVVMELQNHNQRQELHGRVYDTGIGIDESKKQMLFDAFQQADNSSTRQYGGVGLGLSLCKELCLQMGGDIEVDSQQGSGSCFHFHILAPDIR